jgi:hypothetical protein
VTLNYHFNDVKALVKVNGITVIDDPNFRGSLMAQLHNRFKPGTNIIDISIEATKETNPDASDNGDIRIQDENQEKLFSQELSVKDLPYTKQVTIETGEGFPELFFWKAERVELNDTTKAEIVAFLEATRKEMIAGFDNKDPKVFLPIMYSFVHDATAPSGMIPSEEEFVSKLKSAFEFREEGASLDYPDEINESTITLSVDDSGLIKASRSDGAHVMVIKESSEDGFSSSFGVKEPLIGKINGEYRIIADAAQ